MRTLSLIRRDSLMDVPWSRYNELGLYRTRKRIRSSAAKKKELIKRVRVIARRFRWNFEGSRNLIRAHSGISRGERSEKSRNRRRTDPTKNQDIRNLNSSFEWVGHDRRHSSCENLLKITLRFTCTRYVHYLVKNFSTIEVRRLCGIYFYTSKIFLAIVFFDV